MRITRLRRSCFALLISVLPCCAHARGTSEEAKETDRLVSERVAKKRKNKTLLDLYMQGGWLIHPIAGCSLATVAIGVHAFLLTDRRKAIPFHLMPHLHHAISHRRLNEAFETCQGHPGLLTNALGAALARADLARDGTHRHTMEQAAFDSLAHDETQFMYWINLLNVFATIAPMLGLLGTVIGMIQAFDTLASGQSEAQDLAGGIGEVMVTTAGGLIVGIPSMLLYLVFRNNVQKAIVEAHRSISAMLDTLCGEAAPGCLAETES